jgi:hypothetical protein
MAISPNIYDRDKAAYKENTDDGGLDRRVTDVSTQAKLDEVITAIGSGSSSTIYYNEVSSVASGVLTTVITHTAAVPSKLKHVTANGTNIAAYELQLNGTVIAKKYTSFGSSLFIEFDLATGIDLAVSDVIRIRVIHNRTSSGDFNSSMLIQE